MSDARVLAILQLCEGEYVPPGIRVERLLTTEEGVLSRGAMQPGRFLRVYTVLVEETLPGTIENYLRRRGT